MAKVSHSGLLVCTLALVQISHGCNRNFLGEPTAPSSSATYPSTTVTATSSSSDPSTEPPPVTVRSSSSDPLTEPPTVTVTSSSDPSTKPPTVTVRPSSSDPSTEPTSLNTDQTTAGDMDDPTASTYATDTNTKPQTTQVVVTCNNKTGFTTAPRQWPATQSPAGGPAANPQAVVCTYYRITKCLVCRKGDMISKCRTAVAEETDDEEQGGPTPYNEYLIKKWRRHPGHMIDWYDLWPRKEAPLNGYYNYNQPTATGRVNLGLHPGTITLGCATAIDEDGCWADTKKILDMGNMMYNGQGYSGFLYVVPA